MDHTHQWPEGIGVGAVKGASMEERKVIRGQKPQAINCPRCNSSHTKFCYYNNYSLSQPRYFCKSCRRYWTEGGSLRNVPVGGGSRRNNNNNNKRSSSSSSSSSSKKLIIPSDHHQMIPIFSNNHHSKMIIEGQDLNLAYPSAQNGNNYNSTLSHFVEGNRNNYQQHPNTTTTTNTSPAMEFFKINNNDAYSRGFFTNSLMSLPTLDFQDFKPTLNFGFEGGEFGNLQDQDHHNNGSGARVFFPYEDLKVSSSGTTQVEEGNNNRGNVGDDSGNGYWSGSLGGGSW